MKKNILFLLLLITTAVTAQVKGRVTSLTGQPVAFASIVPQGSTAGTASNVSGYYSLAFKDKGEQTIILRAIGYKTKAAKISITNFPHVLDVVMETEEYTPAQASEAKTNPANAIIKNAIASKKVNTAKTARYEADFYSRGIFRIKETPDKILGVKVGSVSGAVDEGLIYLSETVSKVQYNQGEIKEHIIASKVSGDDSGFSFNNAQSAEFDLYKNTLSFENDVISPLADYAFSYYKYAVESTFKDMGQTVYKIKVTPKRDSEPAMAGYIYIADNTWALTAADLEIEGSKIGQPLLDKLALKQTYGYNAQAGTWTKNVQAVEFGADIMGIGYAGRFSFVYSNFNLNPQFSKLGNEVLTFEENADKEEDAFWESLRPQPLTQEEAANYKENERLLELEKSETYMDSIDKRRNRFRILAPILGYTFHNSYDNWLLRYSGVATRFGFNTVQGYNFAPEFSFTKTNPDNTSSTTIGLIVHYGFAEQRLRSNGYITHKFNNFTKRTVTLAGGSSIEQFNPAKPINRMVNSIATLFFRENYMKLYDNNFLRLSYQEEPVNGIEVTAGVEYARRHALFNNTNFSTLKDMTKPYTSNNPFIPFGYDIPSFEEHHIVKASIGTRITFAQKYWSRPDGKINQPTLYPRLYLRYEKGFAATVKDYNFDHLSTRVTYDVTLENKGDLGINLRAGKFFNSDNIAFPDYRHFNGNQTNIGTSERYMNDFNFLPYYTHSTNDKYFEAHFEHNFNGFITNKIPLFNKLDYHLVVGYHFLSVPQFAPYHEATIGLDNVGWGRFRYLRIDYIRSFDSGFRSDGVIFGLKFLDIFE